ncbi:MAG: tetratricopeptide repeat protein [Myxococcota bacterium]
MSTPNTPMTPEQAQALAQLGHVHLEHGQYDKAVALFEGLHALRHKTDFTCEALGVAYFRLGRLQEAASMLSEALQSKRAQGVDDWLARTVLAEVYVKAGDTTSAQRLMLDGGAPPSSAPPRVHALHARLTGRR